MDVVPARDDECSAVDLHCALILGDIRGSAKELEKLNAWTTIMIVGSKSKGMEMEGSEEVVGLEPRYKIQP